MLPASQLMVPQVTIICESEAPLSSQSSHRFATIWCGTNKLSVIEQYTTLFLQNINSLCWETLNPKYRIQPCIRSPFAQLQLCPESVLLLTGWHGRFRLVLVKILAEGL